MKKLTMEQKLKVKKFIKNLVEKKIINEDLFTDKSFDKVNANIRKEWGKMCKEFSNTWKNAYMLSAKKAGLNPQEEWDNIIDDFVYSGN